MRGTLFEYVGSLVMVRFGHCLVTRSVSEGRNYIPSLTLRVTVQTWPRQSFSKLYHYRFIDSLIQ
jgi:CO dehydrogenase/acetyl-CoA synthase gamma subunit (corrinoid Fe-S protein)